jgi:VWFA-related protein
MRQTFLQRTTSVFLSVALAASAQQVGQNNTGNAPPTTFTTTTQLVVETVSVKDKSGKPITGLTKENFTVTEDGMPQTIRFFEYQQLDDTAPAPVTLATRTPAAGTDAPPDRPKVESVTAGQISGETPGTTKYRDRRLLAMYFDMTAMPVPDQLRALAAAQKFIQTQMSGPDLMCIMEYAGAGVKVLNDFTDDRETLLATIDKLVVGEGQGFDQTDTTTAADTGAAFGQDDSEFNIFYTDRQLASLQTAVKMLGSLNEKKALIYFASGLNLNGTDNQAQLHATVNAAIRADVSFYPIDSRGLIASSPLGDATRGSQGGQGLYTGATAMAFTNSLQRSQDTLYTLASDTGGKALLDNNELAMGIVQAEKGIGSYYLIGYYTSNQSPDGKFRRIKITLNNGLAANLDFRQGYYANKVFSKFTTADKERQLEDALMMGDPITELTVAMEIDYFQLNTAEYFVPIMVKIPGSELELARKGGAEHTLIDFIGEIKDDYGSTVTNVRDHMDIKLTDATAAELGKRPIQYFTGFTILPGKYKMKFLARDAETGRIGTFESPFVIPNLNKEDKRVPISSVVLSSQRTDLKDAVFTVKDKNNAELVDPLVLDGQKLIPSVTRVFSKSKDMYIYLQAYERGQTTEQPLVAFVTFYKGQTKAFETPPLAVTEGMNAKSKAVPMRFSIALSKLPPGEYNCQVTVLDPNGNKAAFWQAPVMLIP